MSVHTLPFLNLKHEINQPIQSSAISTDILQIKFPLAMSIIGLLMTNVTVIETPELVCSITALSQLITEIWESLDN